MSDDEREEKGEGFQISGITPEDMAKFGGEEGLKAAVLKKVESVLPPGRSVASITRNPTLVAPPIAHHSKVLANGVHKIGQLEHMPYGDEAIQAGLGALRNLIEDGTKLVETSQHTQPHPLNLPYLMGEDGLEPNPDQLTPVHSAATNGSPKTLKVVLDSGHADLNKRNGRGETPLRMLVARHGSQPHADECARLLIERMNEPGQLPDLTLPVPLSELNEVRRQGGDVLKCLRDGYVAKQIKEVQEAKRKAAEAAEARAKAAKTEPKAVAKASWRVQPQPKPEPK